MAPVWNERSDDRGAVSEGVVGSRLLRGLRMFRYEIRCWHDGRIPDVDEAVDSPQRLIEDAVIAQRVLALVADVPTPGWGRDELHTGEMWNSNSVTAWLLGHSGIDTRLARLTAGAAPRDGQRAAPAGPVATRSHRAPRKRARSGNGRAAAAVGRSRRVALAGRSAVPDSQRSLRIDPRTFADDDGHVRS